MIKDIIVNLSVAKNGSTVGITPFRSPPPCKRI
jgi:hypothetical protein